MKLVLVAAGLLLLGVLLGLDHVRSQFEHTVRSRRILAIEAAASLLIGAIVAVRLVPHAVHWAVLLGMGLALPVFTLMAVITVEVWRVSHNSEFNAEISRLESQQMDIMERRDELQRRLSDLKRRRSRRDVRSDAGLFRRKQLERQVNTWAQEGGFARIRSLKVEDWIRQISGLDADELSDCMDDLDRQARRADVEGNSDLAEQVQAHRALVEAHYLDRYEGRRADDDPDELDKMIEELGQDIEECGARLREVEVELEAWRRRKSFFQRQRLRLD